MASSTIFSFKFNPYVFDPCRPACLALGTNFYGNHLKIDRGWQRNFVYYEENLSGRHRFSVVSSTGHGEADCYRPEFITKESKVIVRTTYPFQRIPSNPKIRYCDLPTFKDSEGHFQCAELGQKVKIHFKVYETDNYKKPKTEKEKEIYLRDDDPFYPGLTEAIIGMKLNQTRRIVLPPELSFGKLFESESYRVFDVTLKKIIK